MPDLYVGYTTDFNRATAQSAQEVTEKQVFQPERQSLAWLINNKLLADYHFKYVEAYFLEPDVSNPDDITKILNITERAGGLTPNKAKEITYKIFGETSENFEGDWGDIPLAYSKTAQSGGFNEGTIQQVEKSVEHSDIELMSVMKETRNFLIKNDENQEKLFTFLKEHGIIEKDWDESAHPRDERGQFASGGSGESSSGRRYNTKRIVGTVTSTGVKVNKVTEHAKQRMRQRHISADEIINALTSKKSIVGNGHTENIKMYFKDGTRVVFDERKGNVVTCMHRKKA